jgi:hypothetical protein
MVGGVTATGQGASRTPRWIKRRSGRGGKHIFGGRFMGLDRQVDSPVLRGKAVQNLNWKMNAPELVNTYKLATNWTSST